MNTLAKRWERVYRNPNIMEIAKDPKLLAYGIKKSQALYDEFCARFDDIADVACDEMFFALYYWDRHHTLLIDELTYGTATGEKIKLWARQYKIYLGP